MITIVTYRNYLINLKDMVFKVLPLYEENSETLDEYLDSMIFELYGLEYVLAGLPHDIWYVKTVATLEAFFHQKLSLDDKKKVKKEVFKMLSLIDKQIDQLKGE